MDEPEEIRFLGLPDIELALQYIRSAESALGEFEQLIVWRFTLLGRKATFLNRDIAANLAINFEGYMEKSKHVEGSLAWILLDEPDLPSLDVFLADEDVSYGRTLKKVIKARKQWVAELTLYYKKEQASLLRAQQFDTHLAIESELG